MKIVAAPPETAPTREPGGLERRLALDLLAVLEAEVPDVDPVVVGLAIADLARRREAQGAPA